jgi:uncharacterized repeat protein (TIGR03833 family)
MRGLVSVNINDNKNYDWYKIGNTIIGAREKVSGGFGLKVFELGSITTFINLIKKIIEYYQYQFITFDSRNLTYDFEIELRKFGFDSYQNYNMVYQSKPRIGDSVLIAIKPYIGRYESGIVKRVLTGAKFHPRGFKVMLNDKNETIGRIATIIKKNHKKS